MNRVFVRAQISARTPGAAPLSANASSWCVSQRSTFVCAAVLISASNSNPPRIARICSGAPRSSCAWLNPTTSNCFEYSRTNAAPNRPPAPIITTTRFIARNYGRNPKSQAPNPRQISKINGEKGQSSESAVDTLNFGNCLGSGNWDLGFPALAGGRFLRLGQLAAFLGTLAARLGAAG